MELDDLLDELPPSLARRVAAALAPDHDDDDEIALTSVGFLVTGYQPIVEPCPVTFTHEDIDKYIPYPVG